MNIVEMLVPDAYVFKNSNGYQRKWLVLHKTAGGSTAQNVASWFQSGAGGAYTSVHYIVGLDGVIVRCVREQDGAGGNCCLESGHDAFWPTNVNLNWVTFSIENVDPTTDNSTPMPTAQKQSLFWLVKDLCTRQSIPMRPADNNGGIAGHNSIAPQSRARCPGNFAWNELWAFLKGASTVTPNKWQIADAQKEWQSTAHLFGGTAPNYDSGIAKAWMQRVYQGQRLGPPLTAEYDSTDWGGNPIRVQQFANARCEWRTDGSSCRFFDAHGEIV
jgi:N-acetyl-anhydromuramyl-L-alanine amidase AmpD